MAVQKMFGEGTQAKDGKLTIHDDVYVKKFGTGEEEGRPVRYSDDLVAIITQRLAAGYTMATICTDPRMPNRNTIFEWLHKGRKGIEPYATFAALVDEARQHGTDAIVEDIFEIADDGHNDWMEKNFGGSKSWVVNGEAVQRSKLRVESRMWYLSKILPKKYGDKLDVTSGGEKLPQPLMGGASKKPEIVEGQIVERKELGNAQD